MKKPPLYTLTLILLITTILPITTLTSCARPPKNAYEILSAMTQTQPNLPAGQTYRGGAAAAANGHADDGHTNDGHADDELLAVLYGEGSLPCEFEVINDYAIRLSGFAAPYELAVFCCVSSKDAYDVAQMCLRRAEALRISGRETPWESITEGARVCLWGRYVLMAVGDDPLAAIEAGRRAAG